MARVTLRFEEEAWNPEARGILMPVPPDTPSQTLLGLKTPLGLRTKTVEAQGYPQKALWMESDEALKGAWEFAIGPGKMDRAGEAFTPRLNRYTELPEGMKETLEPLRRSALDNDRKAQELAARIFGGMAYRNYSSDASGKDFTPAVVCGIADGNCLDMNTMLLAMLYHFHIPAAYNIGWFFPDGQPPQVNGWHCWISTWGDHYLEWDISHRLIKDMEEAAPGFNAFPGKRIAMSWGRGLCFRLGPLSMVLSHFGTPKWVTKSGTTLPVKFQATWSES
jgi:transglutaminase-like putative cysteine protease